MKTLVKHYTASLRTALRDSSASAFYMLAMRRSHPFEGGDISGVPVPFVERTSPTKSIYERLCQHLCVKEIRAESFSIMELPSTASHPLINKHIFNI
ncbi:hypothetical protein [Porphyromonas endodontalis]|uniref:hypothetical protein n=1 Tax=Porphyromonas endodontalis TaxID=28124 RepID=UPI00360EC684